MGGEFSKPHWKDVSNWAKTDVDRTPKAWEARIGDHFSLVVMRHNAFPPDAWCWLFFPVITQPLELTAKDIQGAKLEALIKAERILRGAIERLEAVYG